MPTYREAGGSILYDVVKVQTCSGQPLEVTTASGNLIYTQPGGTSVDSFGRQRVSNPLTLFDSSHRFSVNGNWFTATNAGGTATFNADQGLVDLTIPATSGSYVYRETNKVFPYQPGKSLLVMTSFVMGTTDERLQQRVGYFDSKNGIYFQRQGGLSIIESPITQDATIASGVIAYSYPDVSIDSGVTVTISSGGTWLIVLTRPANKQDFFAIVKRSNVSGTVVETVVPQSEWNGDKLDGTGKSGLVLDTDKAQLLWTDIEWLGVGSVRVGFVLNGQFIVCHTFNHANFIESTYMTTAALPVRYEIEALDTLTKSSTLKEICATVISEGGYQIRGQSRSAGTSITSPYTFTTSGVAYPMVSLRLKTTPNRLDAVVIPNAISFVGNGNNAIFNWEMVAGGTTSGGTWATTDSGSSVEYNINGTSISGGTILAQGYLTANAQGANALEVTTDDLFKYQLQRNSFTSTPVEITFVIKSKNNANTGYAAIDWEEITT